MDVKNVFLHGNITEEIYMKISPGFENKTGKVCKLKRALYGLKQTPRAWNEVFDNYIKSIGLQQTGTDKCLYVIKSEEVTVYLLLYVDDIIIAGNNVNKIESIKSALKNRFQMTDLGELHSFLGIATTRTDGKITLSQKPYLHRLLSKFNMEDCKPVQTPMESKPSIHDEDELYDEPRP